MHNNLTGRLLAALIFQASVATAGLPTLFDAVTTHTNGMPLASADPQRDADLVGGCNRDHIGCCGGRYNMPLMRSIMDPRRCSTAYCGKRPTPSNETPGAVLYAGGVAPAFDGMEAAQMEFIGAAPNSVTPAGQTSSP